MYLFLSCSHSFEEDSYLEFSRVTQDRILGTQDEKAHVSFLSSVYRSIESTMEEIPLFISFDTAC